MEVISYNDIAKKIQNNLPLTREEAICKTFRKTIVELSNILVKLSPGDTAALQDFLSDYIRKVPSNILIIGNKYASVRGTITYIFDENERHFFEIIEAALQHLPVVKERLSKEDSSSASNDNHGNTAKTSGNSKNRSFNAAFTNIMGAFG